MKNNISEGLSPESRSGVKIALATAGALSVAALVLVTTILPAEFNRDPLGTGAAMGLMGLSESDGRTRQTVEKEETKFHKDTVSFELLPFEYVEYKYQLALDSTLLYNWTASEVISFDFHGESHDVEGFEKSYSMGKEDHEYGAFVAPFNGIHGWFWENRGANTVTITLTTAGFYTEALKFRDGQVEKKDLSRKL